VSRLRSTGLLIAGVAGVAVAGWVLRPEERPPSRRSAAPVSPARRAPTPAPGDRAPSEPEYRAALRLGLEGDLAAGQRAMAELASRRPGSETGAWALYQATLAARARRRPAEAATLFARLEREYPEHALTLRARPQAGSAAPPRAKPDCAARALVLLARAEKRPLTLGQARAWCAADEHGTPLDRLAAAARRAGIATRAAQVDARYLAEQRLRGLAWVNGVHYAAFFPAPGGNYRLEDPNKAAPETLSPQELRRRCQGVVLLVTTPAPPT
jgi:hypothetical protein